MPDPIDSELTTIPNCRDGPLLIVVEGTNDVRFLKHLSVLVHQEDSNLPNLARLEQDGTVVFIPFGGGSVLTWCERLAPLGSREFHIYDREVPPETAVRETAVDRINRRLNCRAFLTNRPTAEHYLLPTLSKLQNSAWPVPDLAAGIANQIAATWYSQRSSFEAWYQLPVRRRHRYMQRAKSWLYGHVLPQMTRDHLQTVDPDGEIQGWLRAMADLLSR